MNDIMFSPLILALALDDKCKDFFNSLRKEHFPPNINYLNAHLTLFHKLPADQPEAMMATENFISGWPSFTFNVTGLINLGRGVAYRISSESLTELHFQLQAIWKPWLTGQDSQKLRPHITIQNKVEPLKARQLLEKLSTGFTPFDGNAHGIDCFEYKEGPWKFKSHISFSNV